MSQPTPTADLPVPRSPWIVSPAWDLAFVIATPLVIVPAVLIAAANFLTPQEIALSTLAFASLGHHLPGFMRSYGDRELFARFRWRFLLIPPLIFGLALLFSPPRIVAETLGLHWHHLHGLDAMLILWGTWHGLMQTYGFMRIYDMQRGVDSLPLAWLDQTLCLTMFAAGYVFSDGRMYETASVLWAIGFPAYDRAMLGILRAVVGAALIVVVAIYVVHLVRSWRSGREICWPKIALAALTGWVYWYTGSLEVNMLVGLAMFEIYHAVQYDAIVWVYNRRATERTGSRQFGPLGFLFRNRWSMLGLYLVLILAYGGLRLFAVDTADYTFHGGDLDTHQLIIAFLVTSTLMHFYVDGFIWKKGVRPLFPREKRPDPFFGARHAAKWAVFFGLAGWLMWMESRKVASPDYESASSEMLGHLAALTPDLPELHIQQSRDALARGDTAEAIRWAQQALDAQPHSDTARGDLAVALMEAGRNVDAKPLLEEAIRLNPDQWRHQTNLGLVHEAVGDPLAAETAYRSAVKLRPNHAEPHRKLAALLLRLEETDEAVETLRQAVRKWPTRRALWTEWVAALSRSGRHDEAVDAAREFATQFPISSEAMQSLGAALDTVGRSDEAVDVLREATIRQPDSATAHYHLGAAILRSGRPREAIPSFRRATNLDAQAADAWFGLGNAYSAIDETRSALAAYAEATRRRPGFAAAHNNRGQVFARTGDVASAERCYRQALANDPDLPEARYNLGLLLLEQGWRDEAKAHLEAAHDLGRTIPRAIAHDAGLP